MEGEPHIPRPTAALYPLTGWTLVRKINGRVTSSQALPSVHFPQRAGQSQLALHQSLMSSSRVGLTVSGLPTITGDQERLGISTLSEERGYKVG